MDAVQTKQILDARHSSSAITSAQNLKWRESVAFDSTLTVPLEPAQVYQFNTRVWADPTFPLAFQKDPDALLQMYGLAKAVPLPPNVETLFNYRLTQEEMDAMRQVLKTAREKGVLSQEAFENTVAQDGYGLPAVAALALVVVVAVAVFVVVV